jgi:hypothetical protein
MQIRSNIIYEYIYIHIYIDRYSLEALQSFIDKEIFLYNNNTYYTVLYFFIVIKNRKWFYKYSYENNRFYSLTIEWRCEVFGYVELD